MGVVINTVMPAARTRLACPSAEARMKEGVHKPPAAPRSSWIDVHKRQLTSPEAIEMRVRGVTRDANKSCDVTAMTREV